MKLTKQLIVTLIEEAMRESDDDAFSIGKLENPLSDVGDPPDEPISIKVGGDDWDKGLSDGTERAKKLLQKGEKQTAKGLLAYIDTVTKHRSPSYKAGYKLAFELNLSAVLGTPPSKGQLTF